jgi:hypothetical protein
MDLIIKRADLLEKSVCRPGLDYFDQISIDQNNGSPDVVFPDGWTALHSAMLYSYSPNFLIWFERNDLIPTLEIPIKNIKSDGSISLNRFPTVDPILSSAKFS